MNAPSHEILKRIAAGTAGPAETAWLRQRLAAYLDAPERGLDAALHLTCAPGEPPWWRVERQRQRDVLLLRLWRERFPSLSAWDAAERIVTIHGRYVAGAWLRQRDRDTPPDDPIAALLWQILKLEVRFPTSRRRIFEILTTAPRDVLY